MKHYKALSIIIRMINNKSGQQVIWQEWIRFLSYLIWIDEEETESHNLDEHVLLGRRQVVAVLEHLKADVDDVAEKVLVVTNLLQVFWKLFCVIILLIRL